MSAKHRKKITRIEPAFDRSKVQPEFRKHLAAVHKLSMKLNRELTALQMLADMVEVPSEK